MDRDNRYIRRVIENGESPVRHPRGRRFDFSPRQALYYNDHPEAIIEDFDRSEYGAVLQEERDDENRVAAAALAAFGAASAIPIPLAQFDFAGLVNAFDIDSGDSPRALLVMAGIGGFLTIAVLALAFAGAGLALAGAPTGRPLLITAALAGLVTAMPLWIPAGIVIGAAAVLLGSPSDQRPSSVGGNALGIGGVNTRTPRQGEA